MSQKSRIIDLCHILIDYFASMYIVDDVVQQDGASCSSAHAFKEEIMPYF